MGLASPSCQQRSITSWQRRSISGVLALHRGEIQVLVALAAGHGRRGATAQADQHGRAAQYDQPGPA